MCSVLGWLRGMAYAGAMRGARGSVGHQVRGVGSAVVGQVAGRSGLALLGSGLSRPECGLAIWVSFGPRSMG